jgi:MFS family permease
MEKQVKNTIPFFLAVVITALLPLPLGMYLGNWNIPLWAAFVVWAQYFVYGAKPSAFKIIVPCFAAGVLFSTGGMVANSILSSFMHPFLAICIGFGVAVAIMVYVMDYVPAFQQGSLAYFNGMAMMLGVYFTGAFPQFGWTTPVLAPIIAGVWAILVGWLGAVFGWFNVTITFPREVEVKPDVRERMA